MGTPEKQRPSPGENTTKFCRPSYRATTWRASISRATTSTPNLSSGWNPKVSRWATLTASRTRTGQRTDRSCTSPSRQRLVWVLFFPSANQTSNICLCKFSATRTMAHRFTCLAAGESCLGLYICSWAHVSLGSLVTTCSCATPPGIHGNRLPGSSFCYHYQSLTMNTSFRILMKYRANESNVFWNGAFKIAY